MQILVSNAMDSMGAEDGLRRRSICIEGCEIECQRDMRGQRDAQEIDGQGVSGVEKRPGADWSPPTLIGTIRSW
jgi:hypothetical protein